MKIQYIYIYIYIYVCVCVCERDRQRQRQRESFMRLVNSYLCFAGNCSYSYISIYIFSNIYI